VGGVVALDGEPGGTVLQARLGTPELRAVGVALRQINPLLGAKVLREGSVEVGRGEGTEAVPSAGRGGRGRGGGVCACNFEQGGLGLGDTLLCPGKLVFLLL
jgi:hypothetical protein